MRLTLYAGTHRVRTVLDGRYPKLLSILEPDATGLTLHSTEAEARRAAGFATPEAWIAIAGD